MGPMFLSYLISAPRLALVVAISTIVPALILGSLIFCRRRKADRAARFVGLIALLIVFFIAAYIEFNCQVAMHAPPRIVGDRVVDNDGEIRSLSLLAGVLLPSYLMFLIAVVYGLRTKAFGLGTN
ncbi:MAG: hypothetical protein AAF764_12275 [Pseudomonadota bacterium]